MHVEKRFRAKQALAACSTAFASLLAACGVPTTTSDEALATYALTSRAGIETYAVVPDQLRLASAEIFRDLAAAAPAMTFDRLRDDARAALYAETGVHRTLGEQTQREIGPYLVMLDGAARGGDRLGVADAAREAMRLIAEDMSPAAEKQAAFTLVDYAQLVIDAALRQSRIDWVKVDRATHLATARLATLDAQASSADRVVLEKDLSSLASAARRRDRDLALSALLRLRDRFDTYRLAVDSPIPDQALVPQRS